MPLLNHDKTMKTQHTLGPWKNNTAATVRAHEGKILVAQVTWPPGTRIAERRANANLIDAAPDLLECLIHMADRDWFQSGMTGEVICGLGAEKVRNALSMALGHNVKCAGTAGDGTKNHE